MIQVWKKRKITIGEFEDVWEANTRFEVAFCLIQGLKDMAEIPLKEKVRFLVEQIRENGGHSLCCQLDNTRAHGQGWGEEAQIELYKRAMAAFFDLSPIWDEEFRDNNFDVLRELAEVPSEAHQGLESKIKKFLHSLLNTKKKEDSAPAYLSKALVKHQMFDELVNYDLTSDTTLNALAELIFGYSWDSFPGEGTIHHIKKITTDLNKVLKKNHEPHAVSTLLRILAKRGDLEKIFQAEATK